MKKEMHIPNICLIYGKWYQHTIRCWYCHSANEYHHIIWKRASGNALLYCGIVENICTLVWNEERPGVPIPSLQLSPYLLRNKVPFSIIVRSMQATVASLTSG